VGTVLPVHRPGIDQTHVRVVHEGCRVPSCTGTLSPNVLSRQPSEVVVDDRGQPLQGLLVPASPGQEERGFGIGRSNLP
jgi:hypothetical protein